MIFIFQSFVLNIVVAVLNAMDIGQVNLAYNASFVNSCIKGHSGFQSMCCARIDHKYITYIISFFVVVVVVDGAWNGIRK